MADRRRIGWRWFCWLPLLLLAGCASESGPLPTRASVLLPPPPPADVAAAGPSLPATYTPDPLSTDVATVWPSPEVTASVTATRPPLPTPTPLATATPGELPLYRPHDVFAPYLTYIPQSADCGRGFTFSGQFQSQIGGWRDFHAYLPPCYGLDGRVYPVLYLIHGSIQTSTHWLELGLADFADEAINSGRYPPFIAIMPYSGNLGNISSGGDKSIEGITLNALLPFVESNFCTWNVAAGRSIGGISRGGYWALEIAFNNAHLFGAVAGHSSHLRFETDPAKYNPLATYAAADLSQMRIWLDRGVTDFLRHGQDELAANLAAAGIGHEYYVNPGGHNDSYWAVHISDYLDWHTAVWPREREGYPLCGR